MERYRNNGMEDVSEKSINLLYQKHQKRRKGIGEKI